MPFTSTKTEVASGVFYQELWNFPAPQSCSVMFSHHFGDVLNSSYSQGAILWGTEKLLGSRCIFSTYFFSLTLITWAVLNDPHAELCPTALTSSLPQIPTFLLNNTGNFGGYWTVAAEKSFITNLRLNRRWNRCFLCHLPARTYFAAAMHENRNRKKVFLSSKELNNNTEKSVHEAASFAFPTGMQWVELGWNSERRKVSVPSQSTLQKQKWCKSMLLPCGSAGLVGGKGWAMNHPPRRKNPCWNEIHSETPSFTLESLCWEERQGAGMAQPAGELAQGD